MKSLKRLLRSAHLETLKSFFAARGAQLPADFDWTLDESKRANAIDKSITGFPDELEDRLRAELETIEEIANSDGWTAIDEVCEGAGVDVPEDGGAEGAAFFVALEHPHLLPKIMQAASMNRYNGGKQWGCYTLEGVQFSHDSVADPKARRDFVDASLAARKFPPGRPQESDWFSAVRRDPVTNDKREITYLTVYFLDRPVREMTMDNNQRFLMALRQRVDETIFAINPDAQEIEVYSKGGTRTHQKIAKAFGQSFFGKAVKPVRVEPRLVNFAPLKRKPASHVSPNDRIESVSVVKLKFFGDGLKSQYEHPSDDSGIYDILRHKHGDRSSLLSDDLIVSATLKIKRRKADGKTLTIDLGYPSRTTLPNQTEEDRALSLRLLERWGLLEPAMPVVDAAE